MTTAGLGSQIRTEGLLGKTRAGPEIRPSPDPCELEIQGRATGLATARNWMGRALCSGRASSVIYAGLAIGRVLLSTAMSDAWALAIEVAMKMKVKKVAETTVEKEVIMVTRLLGTNDSNFSSQRKDRWEHVVT